jgi:hypothetical protein
MRFVCVCYVFLLGGGGLVGIVCHFIFWMSWFVVVVVGVAIPSLPL